MSWIVLASHQVPGTCVHHESATGPFPSVNEAFELEDELRSLYDVTPFLIDGEDAVSLITTIDLRAPRS